MTQREIYYFKGEEHRFRGELEQAIAFYEKALQIDPECEDGLFRAGCCYLKWGQRAGDCFNDNTTRFEKAAALFEKLIGLQESRGGSPGHSYEFYHHLGEAQYHLAITLMQGSTARRSPQGPVWRFYLERAIENYKQAIKLNPGYAESYHWLGNTQLALGLYEEAEVNYKRAIELNPHQISYYYPLATTQDELGLKKEAEKTYDRAIELLVQNNFTSSLKTSPAEPLLRLAVQQQHRAGMQ